MRRLLESKTVAWCAFVVVMAIVILSIVLIQTWKIHLWVLCDELFAFLMVFCQLISVYTRKLNPVAAGKLSATAAVCGVLMIVAFIAEYFLMGS